MNSAGEVTVVDGPDLVLVVPLDGYRICLSSSTDARTLVVSGHGAVTNEAAVWAP